MTGDSFIVDMGVAVEYEFMPCLEMTGDSYYRLFTAVYGYKSNCASNVTVVSVDHFITDTVAAVGYEPMP